MVFVSFRFTVLKALRPFFTTDLGNTISFLPALSADAIKCKRLQVVLDQGQRVSSALVTTNKFNEIGAPGEFGAKLQRGQDSINQIHFDFYFLS